MKLLVTVMFSVTLIAASPLVSVAQELLLPNVVRVASGIDAVDPSGSSLTVDIFNVSITNDSSLPITGLSIDLRQPTVNPSLGNVAFRDDASLLTLLGRQIADSFLVVPEGRLGDILSQNVIDNDGRLAADFVLSGDGALVPAGESAVIATLTVPTGTPLNNDQFVCGIGLASIGGVAVPITGLCPEPSSAMIVTIGMIALGLPRQEPTSIT